MTSNLRTSSLRLTDYRWLPAQQLLRLPVRFRNSIQRFAMASCYAWITRVPVARPASSHRPNASPVGHPLHFHSTSLSRQLTDSNRRSLHAEQLLHNRERDGRAACPRPSPCPSPCCDPSPSGSSSLSPANQERCPFRSPFPQLQVEKQTRHKKKKKQTWKNKKILWAASSDCVCPFFPA